MAADYRFGETLLSRYRHQSMRTLLVPGILLGAIVGLITTVLVQHLLAGMEQKKVHLATTRAREVYMAAFNYWDDHHAAPISIDQLFQEGALKTMPENPFTKKPMEVIQVDPAYGVSFTTIPLEGNIAYLTVDLTKMPDVRTQADADSVFYLLVFGPRSPKGGLSFLGLSNQVATDFSTGISFCKGTNSRTTYQMEFNDFMMYWRQQHLRY